jgi:hypothetical protein
MLLRCTGTAAVPPKTTYVRGIPDGFIQQGGQPNVTPEAYFVGNWTSFVNALKAGWGWVGRGTPVTTNIASITQAAGKLVLALGSTPFTSPPFPVGTVLPVRVSNVTAPGFLNGVHPMVVTAAGVLTTQKNFAFDSYVGNGKVTYNGGGAFQAITDVAFVRIGERRAGRPFGSVRGRSRNRLTA